MSFFISNSSNYNVSLCHIYGRSILTLSVYVIFKLCLTFFDRAQVLSADRIILFIYMYVSVLSLTLIFVCTVHAHGS